MYKLTSGNSGSISIETEETDENLIGNLLVPNEKIEARKYLLVFQSRYCVARFGGS